jgi:hypothetical protein
MHYFMLLAVEAPDAKTAGELATEFLSDYPGETDYSDVLEVVAAAGDDGDIHPNVANRIEEAFLWKDARIAEGLLSFVPLTSTAEQVVTALKPESDMADERRAMWTEALRSGGLSMSIHRNGYDNQRGFVLYGMQKTLKMLNDDFHNEAAFYDTKEMTTSAEWFMKRIRENPSEQWLVALDLHN